MQPAADARDAQPLGSADQRGRARLARVCAQKLNIKSSEEGLLPLLADIAKHMTPDMVADILMNVEGAWPVAAWVVAHRDSSPRREREQRAVWGQGGDEREGGDHGGAVRGGVAWCHAARLARAFPGKLSGARAASASAAGWRTAVEQAGGGAQWP